MKGASPYSSDPPGEPGLVHAPSRGRCFSCRAHYKKGELVWCWRQYQRRTRANHYYGSGCGCAAQQQAEWTEHLETLKGRWT